MVISALEENSSETLDKDLDLYKDLDKELNETLDKDLNETLDKEPPKIQLKPRNRFPSAMMGGIGR